MSTKRNHRQLRDHNGRIELVGARTETNCKHCKAPVIWGQLSPRKWALIDNTGHVHQCRKPPNKAHTAL